MVIVGAGQAAAQAVETLRKRGHSGPITLIGDEDLLPYQRPPLSKKYLAGCAGARPAADPPCRRTIAEHGVDLRLGFAAVKIDRGVPARRGRRRQRVRIRLAAARDRQPPARPGHSRCASSRASTPCAASRTWIACADEIAPGRRGVIVGGGYIGLEVAATCRELGVDVTVLEGADRVMSTRRLARGVGILRGGACPAWCEHHMRGAGGFVREGKTGQISSPGREKRSVP